MPNMKVWMVSGSASRTSQTSVAEPLTKLTGVVGPPKEALLVELTGANGVEAEEIRRARLLVELSSG